MLFSPVAAPYRRRSAYTLVELLVVVVIVAILAAMLVPVLAQAREHGRRTACLSNLRQIGYACLAYVQDHDETFPMNAYPLDKADEQGHIVLGSGGRTAIVYDALLPYLTGTHILQCPVAPERIEWAAVLKLGGLQSSGQIPSASYAWNFALFQDPALGPLFEDEDPVRSMGEVSQPEYTTLFYDAQPLEVVGGLYSGRSDDTKKESEDETVSDRGATVSAASRSDLDNEEAAPMPLDWYLFSGHPRHTHGLNIGFVDGHVRWIPEEGKLPGESREGKEMVPTYTLPVDLSGIPCGASDT